VAVVDAEGLRFLDDDTLAAIVEQIVADRRGNPGGAR
jgi:proteasome beta subunit